MPVLTTLALAAALAVVFAVAHAGSDQPSWRAALVKTGSTALLALAGLIGGAPAWIVAGLALGALGDLALARPGDRAFLAGMIAFALGHLAYVVEFVGRYPGGPLPAPVTPVLVAMAGMVLLTVFWIAPRAGAFCRPVRLYALVIAAMALTAAALPATAGHRVLQLGVTGFVASDLILALRLFVLRDAGARLWAARALWPLYWGGQALILWGVLPAAT